jgi:hypothetical protein
MKMNRRKLHRLKRELAALRRSPQKAAAFERFARKLGRKPVKRGKEPMWESAEFDLYALAIPHHGGRDLAPGTQNSILNQLENDLAAWDQKLGDEEADEDEKHDEEDDDVTG